MKAALLPVNAVLSFITMRLIIETYGPDAYAQYGLLIALAALVPFADLGLAATVLNEVSASKSPRTDIHVRNVITTSIRYLILVSCGIALMSLVITLLGLWPLLLGDGLLPSAGPAVFACVVLFAITLPLGVGQRLMLAFGKNHVQIAIQAIQYPLILGLVAGVVYLRVPAENILPIFSYLGVLVVAIVTCASAGKMSRPLLTHAIQDVVRFRTVRNVPVFHTAWPMLIQMVAVPLGTQTDRLILSQVGGVEALAEYNLASQIFIPIWQVTSAAGVALWPIYARARAEGSIRSPLPMAFIFLAAGIPLAGVAYVLTGPIAELVSAGQIEVGGLVAAAFALYVMANCFLYPLGMFMTDVRGLRLQAIMIAAFLPVNLGVSWSLAQSIGAAGPIVGSLLAMLVAQIIPNLLYIRRRLADHNTASRE